VAAEKGKMTDRVLIRNISLSQMSSGEADISIVKVQFGGFDDHASGHFKKLGILDSVAFWEFELLMFQLVNLQSLALVTVAEIITGQPAVLR